MTVFKQADRRVDTRLAIAIKSIRADQRHTGLIYSIDDCNSYRLCHLAWNYDLRDLPLPAEYFWAPINLDDINERMFIAFIPQFLLHKQEIPYAIDCPGEPCWTETGDFIPMPLGKGLTCATFVMMLFKQIGIDLINRESWPDRPTEDTRWQQYIVQTLAQQNVAEEVIEALRADVGRVKRFRPEEVAGASTAPIENWPVEFPEASVLATEILHALAS